MPWAIFQDCFALLQWFALLEARKIGIVPLGSGCRCILWSDSGQARGFLCAWATGGRIYAYGVLVDAVATATLD